MKKKNQRNSGQCVTDEWKDALFFDVLTCLIKIMRLQAIAPDLFERFPQLYVNLAYLYILIPDIFDEAIEFIFVIPVILKDNT
jgi:hypothetical protein